MKDRWANKYAKCIKCGLTKHPHEQHGYCLKCWDGERYQKHKKYYKEYYQKYWLKNKEKLSQKRKEQKLLRNPLYKIVSSNISSSWKT